jgi:hypothetical protein
MSRARKIENKLNEISQLITMRVEPDSSVFRIDFNAQYKELFLLLRKIPKYTFIPRGTKSQFIYLKNLIDGVFDGFSEKPFKKNYLQECLEEAQGLLDLLQAEWCGYADKIDEELKKIKGKHKTLDKASLGWQGSLAKIKEKILSHDAKAQKLQMPEEQNDVDNIDWQSDEASLKSFLSLTAKPGQEGVIRTPVLLSTYLPRPMALKMQKLYNVKVVFNQYTIIQNMTVFCLPQKFTKKMKDSFITSHILKQKECAELTVWSAHVVKHRGFDYYLMAPKGIVALYTTHKIAHWSLNPAIKPSKRPDAQALYEILET